MSDIKKFEVFVHGFPNPAWLAKGNGECIYANAALERFTRLHSDQIKHAHWRSFLLREDRAVASASWQRLFATGTPYRVHVRSQPLDRFRVRGSHLGWLLLLLLVVTFNQWPLLFGQTPPSARLHVDHNSWTFKDGAPADVVCLAQTNDGFLWLGGPNGLFRFDGTRFEPFRSPFGDRLFATNLYSLFAPPSGGLWVGYAFGGFSFLNNGPVTNYGGDIASSSGSVYDFAQDRDGIVWAATSSGLWRFDHSAWQPIRDQWNAPAELVTQIGFDRNGILWALAGSLDPPMDLIYLLPGSRHFKAAGRNLSVDRFLLDADRAVMTDPAAPPMADSSEDSEKKPAAYPVLTKGSQQFLDRNNSLWISYDDKPIVMRLPRERLRGDLNRASSAGSESYDIFPFLMAQLVDREGNIWFGDTKGIYRFSYSPLNRQEFLKEASENADFALAADDNGAVWISSRTSLSAGDLYYVSGGKAQHRLPPVTSSFAYRAPDRTFWFSGKGCLWHLVGHDFVRVNLPPEVANQYAFLQTITGDEQGGIWVSFGRRGLYRFADGIWTSYGGRDDLPKTGTLMIEFTDRLGRLWFGYTKNQLALLDGDRVRLFGPNDGLQVGTIAAIHGRGSEIWIGGEFGLEQYDQGRFHNIAAVNDEWLRGISGIVETANGDLWLNAISGIFHVRKGEISAALKDSNHRVKGKHFGRFEGLPGISAPWRPLPTAIEGTDGRLWFSLGNGMVWLDPAAYSEEAAASPPITIQSVAADDKSYPPAPRVSLPAHTSSVQISYSAVSLSDPEAIRFRYKLQETDKDWNEATAATPVTYRNLPPGFYHFSVEASDTNGDWSDAFANLAFTIQPAYYQTVWFRALCVLTFLAMLWTIYQLRVRALERRHAVLEKHQIEIRALNEQLIKAQEAERIRISGELHDGVLQQITSLTLRLGKVRNQVSPDSAAKATVSALQQELIKIGTDIRHISHELHPALLQEAGLPAALSAYCEEFSKVRGLSVSCEADESVQELSPGAALCLYRIAQEALGNAGKYSEAKKVEVRLTRSNGTVCLSVSDDGIGCALEQLGKSGGLGVINMRERVLQLQGTFQFESTPGRGTTVKVEIPFRSAT